MPRYRILGAEGGTLNTIRCESAEIDTFVALEEGTSYELVGDGVSSTERERAIWEVNRVCGGLRQKFLTDLPMQDMIYLEKRQEARAWLSASDPDPADYVYLSAEEGLTAPTITEVAQTILGMSVQAHALGAEIEKLRIGSVIQMEQVTTQAELDAALEVFEETSEAMGAQIKK